MRKLVIWEMFIKQRRLFFFTKDEEMTPLAWMYYSMVYDRKYR